MISQQLKNKIAELTLGKSMTICILAKEGEISFEKYRKYRSRRKKLNREFKKNKAYMTNLYDICLQYLSPVTSPIALISQIHRSGGSLVSQLFDGHPEVHAHPYELKIGYPRKYIWPKIDLNDRPERWFEVLFEDNVIKDFKQGYKKGKRNVERFPFIFLPSLQREIFLKYINSVQSITLRDVFNAYMTSYFGAWLNNQNVNGQKKFVTAFTPRLSTMTENMESFFEIYPDGRLISIVRDPKNWFPSAHRHQAKRRKYDEIRSALSKWIESTKAMVRNKERYQDNVCIIKFEDLVSKTEPVMRHLTNFLDIQFDEILLTPTFNKAPIRANTSFESKQSGILNSTLSRYKTLKEEELEIIDEMTTMEYQKVCDHVVKF